MAELDKVLKAATNAKASDLHLAPGEPFVIRQLGRLRKIQSASLTRERCEQLIYEILENDQKEKLNKQLQLDFAYEIPEVARFRGSAMRHQAGLSASFRIIPFEIPTFEKLGLPDTVKKIMDNHQGLILVTGATGQGKSSTMAAMVDYVNTNRAHHIITVEDPIEFIHPQKKCAVNQRQLGRDTLAYANALRGALREDPDVIVVGELRDLETISLSITAAETGHLVIGTLATSSAPKTIDRIIDSYPAAEQGQIRAMLGESIKAVITQRLIPRADLTSMALAVEILIGTLPMANLIRDGKVFQILSMMQMGKAVGMQIMDESIMSLFKAGTISATEAYLNANNKALFKPLAEKES
ncbi:MAG: type IV pilus twitching motility protein PilT [Deltaproteobacteria bacterium]|nr:type IV pilus twitching motility protein PilT [Deltaproteobacteria bacterium]